MRWECGNRCSLAISKDCGKGGKRLLVFLPFHQAVISTAPGSAGFRLGFSYAPRRFVLVIIRGLFHRDWFCEPSINVAGTFEGTEGPEMGCLLYALHQPCIHFDCVIRDLDAPPLSPERVPCDLTPSSLIAPLRPPLQGSWEHSQDRRSVFRVSDTRLSRCCSSPWPRSGCLVVP